MKTQRIFVGVCPHDKLKTIADLLAAW